MAKETELDFDFFSDELDLGDFLCSIDEKHRILSGL